MILTRPAAESAALAATLRSSGHDVVELPCIATDPLADDSALAAAVRQLTASDRLVVTSQAGAAAVLATGLAIAAPVATVGGRAATLLRARGADVDRVAATGRELASDLALPAGHVLLARSDRALPDLPQILAARGARVREVVAYRTVARVEGDTVRARALAAAGAAIVVASPGAFDALVDALGATVASRGRFIATGPTTAEHVRAHTGHSPAIAPWHRVAEVI